MESSKVEAKILLHSKDGEPKERTLKITQALLDRIHSNREFFNPIVKEISDKD